MSDVTVLYSDRMLVDGTLTTGCIEISDGRIATVSQEKPAGAFEDLSGRIVAPGFIDLHCNGGGGASFETADTDGIVTILDTFVRTGTTSMLGAINTAPREVRMATLERIDAWRNARGRAELLGVYMEGPYFNPDQRGAHRADWMRDPDPDEYGEWIARFGDLVRVVSLAPERAGSRAAIRAFVDAGIVAAMGHTMATDAQVDAAIEAGISLVTHIYNAQSTYTRHDEGKHLGVAEMGLLRDALTVEIIPDGHHLTPAMLEWIVKVKPHDGICLTTDAMEATGKGPGEYEVMGQRVRVTDEVAYRHDGKRHAGSILTMDRGVRNLVAAGASLEDALGMASAVPARTIGVGDRKGAIRKGMDADLVVLDDALNVARTICGGKEAFRR